MKRTITEVHKSKILVVGATPPPFNGMSVFLNHLLHSHIAEEFEIILLDTADRRPLSNIGRLDLTNVRLAVLHGVKFLWLVISCRPDLVYIPIAQNVLGYLRDSLFLVPSRLPEYLIEPAINGYWFSHAIGKIWGIKSTLSSDYPMNAGRKWARDILSLLSFSAQE